MIIDNPTRNRRWVITAIVILVILWAVTMILRWEIRARWWTYQLNNTQSREEQNFYLMRLTAISDKSFYALTSLLDNPKPEIRKIGERKLVHHKGPRAGEYLKRFLSDECEDIAAGAAQELAVRNGIPAVLPILRGAMLADKPDLNRQTAAYCLEKIGGTEAEKILLETIPQIKDPDLLAQIVDSLGIMGSQAAVPVIKEMLADQRLVKILPVSQRQVLQAIAALQDKLSTQGINQQDLLDSITTQQTVASIAQRALQLINTQHANNPASQPSTSTNQS